jgi:hypothetical protein
MAQASATRQDRRSPLPRSAIVAAVGLVAWLIGAALDSRQALFSYLAAYMYVLSTLLGMLLLLMSIHAARSEWPIVVRRLIENVTGVLPLMVVLFLPIALGVRKIYSWAGAEPITESVQRKLAYLNPPFFYVRAAIYFSCWVGLGYVLRSWSLRQDADGDPSWSLKQWRLSGIGLIATAFTLTFASIDWLMSLTPDWDSSVFGVYIFAGGFVAAFALLAILMLPAARAGLPVSAGHFLSTGKFMLAFVVFWVYTGFSQYFLIWIADIPREVSWWLPRSQGWGWFSIMLAVVQFVLPFFVLLSRGLKMKPRALAAVATWLLAAHYLDIYWLVLPTLHKDGPHPHWLDLAALLFMVGASVAFGLWRAQGVAPAPTKDPRFAASVAYEGS